MTDSVSDAAQRILDLAHTEAIRLDHEYVGTAHLLLALIREGTNRAAVVLRRLNVRLDTVRAELKKIGGDSHPRVHSYPIPQSPRFKSAIEYAGEEARLSAPPGPVEPEHLLAGLLREQEGVAFQILQKLGLDWEAIALALLRRKLSPSSGLITTTPIAGSVFIRTADEGIERAQEPPGEGIQRAQEVDRVQEAPSAESAAASSVQVPDLRLPSVRLGLLARLRAFLFRLMGVGTPLPGDTGTWNMYERFTDRARKVMQLANQEAKRFNHEYIGTEHILLGLVKEGSGVAASVLKNLGIELRKVRLEVEKIVQSGPDMVTAGRLPRTPRAKKVIEYSIEEARNLNHNYVGTEHLLLGLLREQEGVAAQVLMDLGARLEQVREKVSRLLHGTS